jgi:glycosyltransferase involved in cell wall biosynthesis
MKILFLSPRLPHAAVTGGHVIVRERIRRLAARGHQIGLACFTEGDDLQHASDLKSLLVELETRPLPKPINLASRAVRLYCSPTPPYFADFADPELKRRVGEMVENGHYDVAVAEFSAMGQYLFRNPHLPAVRRVLSCHYSVAMSFRKVADVLRFRPRGLRSWLNIKSLQHYEIEMFRHMDRVLTLTAQERFEILHHEPALRLTAIPAGVDTAHFAPVEEARREDAILFTGHYANLANLDAVMWFVHEVWPAVKRRHANLKFYVVGPGAERTLRDLSRRDPNIVVTGEVADIRDYLRRARVFVCPVRLGSGLRVKILEAMAMGLPIVTTALGGEGMPLHTGDNCFIADQPQLMSDYIDILLTDDELRGSISRQARALAVDRFAWEHSIDMLEDVLEELPARR